MTDTRKSDELIFVNQELVYQNQEKEKRALELIIANQELVFQNAEKGKRAAELVIANEELVFQNEEKGKRAAELIIANKELIFQNGEKEKRAAELAIANKELVFQNEEKGKRAAELAVANTELAFQNEEKGKRAVELMSANKELLAFNYISSHDLHEPLRKIQIFTERIMESELPNLSDKGKDYFRRIQTAVDRMEQLLSDLLSYARINATERKFEKTDLRIIIAAVKRDLRETIEDKQAVIEYTDICPANIIPFQFHQLMLNLLSNALKFSIPGITPHIEITSRYVNGADLNVPGIVPEKEYCHISVKDNGIGFEAAYCDRIFEVFQKLHSKEEYAGTGIGLAIVKKIVENHYGVITATSELSKGATFDIYLPV